MVELIIKDLLGIENNLNSSDFKNKRFIHFEGIMGVSKIWINGELVKTHFGGLPDSC